MTIQPLRESFIVHCDTRGCPNCFEVETTKFDELRNHIMARRWTFYKDKNDKWSHKCTACQEGGK